MSDRIQNVLYSYKVLAFEHLLKLAIEDDAATNKFSAQRSIITPTNRPQSSNQPATSTPDGLLTSVRRFEEGISMNLPPQSPTYSCSLMPSSSSEQDISRVQKSTTKEPESSMFQSVEVLNQEEDCFAIPPCPERVSNSKPTADDANTDNEYAIGASGEGYCQTISKAEYERQKIFIKLQETKSIMKSIMENPHLSEEYKLMMIKRCIQTNLSVAEEVMGKDYIWKLRLQMHQEEQEKKKGFLNSVKKLTKRIPSFRRK